MGNRGGWIAAAFIAAARLYAQSPASDSIVLEPGKVIEREISGTQAHSYRLPLAEGECAILIVEQRGIDVSATVYYPLDKPLAVFDFEKRKTGEERVLVVAEQPGEYRAAIRAAYPQAPAGHYAVRIAERRAATATERSVFQARRFSLEASQLNVAGKFADAIAATERAVETAETALGANDVYIGDLLSKLGLLEQRTGAYERAEAHLARAIRLSENALGRGHPQTLEAIRWLAAVYTAEGRYGKAEPLLEEQVGAIEKALGPEHPLMVRALSDISHLHQLRGDMERALAEQKRVLAIAEKVLAPDDTSLIGAISNLGDFYSLVGDNQHAEPLLERALAMTENKYGPDHYYVSIPLQSLGSIARTSRHYQRARELLSRAKAIREKSLGSLHQETLSLAINIANVYSSEGNYSKALELYRQAWENLVKTVGPYHRLSLMAVANMATAYTAQGDLEHALEYRARYDEVLEKNIGMNLALGSEREKLAYVQLAAIPASRTISLNLREAPKERAVTELAAMVALEQKGRVLDAVSGSISALRRRLNASDGALLDQFAEANAVLARAALGGPGKTTADEFETRMGALERRREQLEAAISTRSAEFRVQSQPVTLAAVTAAIPPAAALIEIILFLPYNPKLWDDDAAYEEAHYALYVLRREGVSGARDLGSAKPIDDAADALRKALRDPRRKDAADLARALDEKLMRPARALAGDAAQLLISPDGDLNLIPFEALMDEQGRYLVERYSISYLTTGRDLLRIAVPRPSKSGMVVIANPHFGEPPAAPLAKAHAAPRRSVTAGADLQSVYFAPLAGTVAEARAIQSLFPSAAVLTGQQATKASLERLQAPRLLHIATHGFYLQEPGTKAAATGDGAQNRAMQAGAKIENPLLRSGLALAGANLEKNASENGILTALEAANLNLWGTKLVTLSACESGVGEVRNGEGVYGLRRAFFLAGAESMVMSLWSVSDRVTQEMMTAYYTGLKNGIGRGEALRQAQLAMLKRGDRRHPFYWASFIQAGDWRSLEGR
jgi:CHAT domain-containing protein/tetratricopeptide (TPR) repeat protein